MSSWLSLSSICPFVSRNLILLLSPNLVIVFFFPLNVYLLLLLCKYVHLLREFDKHKIGKNCVAACLL